MNYRLFKKMNCLYNKHMYNLIFLALIISSYAQFNKQINLNGPQIRSNEFNHQRTTYQYIPPQSIGGGFQSQGGYVKMLETYDSPKSIGGGFQSPGGWASVRDEPYVGAVAQTIIDIAEFMAGDD